MIKFLRRHHYLSLGVNFLTSPSCRLILILIGIYLRLHHYFGNRPLWLDETYVAVQTIDRSWFEIFTVQHIFVNLPLAPLFFADEATGGFSVLIRVFLCWRP